MTFDYRKWCSSIEGRRTIIGGDEYRHSAVLVPFVQTQEGSRILFETRAPSIRQGGEVGFPGGGVEPETDSESRETALRETEEELGLERELISVDRYFGSTVNLLGALIDVWVGRLFINGLDDLLPNKHEVDDVFLVPLKNLQEQQPETFYLNVKIEPDNDSEKPFSAAEIGLPSRYHRSWPGASHSIHLYRYGDHIIWGVTAKILKAILASIQSLPDR
ncbi:MAG: NUDIX domain-containing protein [Spirochaetales bacterium]|nr:NUDIX domain-containing protein [Spirochaetales bacterium]MCF7939650.1 NUDIX domain-containing protein [Spirochaetales bacterium]